VTYVNAGIVTKNISKKPIILIFNIIPVLERHILLKIILIPLKTGCSSDGKVIVGKNVIKLGNVEY
jgi:hypothetical protein